jgi:exodeoxyribonuclease VII small subunit
VVHADDPPVAESGFDRRLARLEVIVAELEGEELDLEPAIERYREGVVLLKECRSVLAGFRRQVEELSKSAEESLRPYAGDPDLGPAAGSAGRDRDEP